MAVGPELEPERLDTVKAESVLPSPSSLYQSLSPSVPGPRSNTRLVSAPCIRILAIILSRLQIELHCICIAEHYMHSFIIFLFSCWRDTSVVFVPGSWFLFCPVFSCPLSFPQPT